MESHVPKSESEARSAEEPGGNARNEERHQADLQPAREVRAQACCEQWRFKGAEQPEYCREPEDCRQCGAPPGGMALEIHAVAVDEHACPPSRDESQSSCVR